MDGNYIISGSVILVSILTIVVFFGIWFFGKLLYKRYTAEDQFIYKTLDNLNTSANGNNLNRHFTLISNYLGSLLETRNDFWTIYGQMVICLFIIAVLTILLLTKTISQQAGLPILSAVAGFAISNKNGTSNNKPNGNFPKE